jgi:hypothetical protein
METTTDILSYDGGRAVFEYYGFATNVVGKKQPTNPLREERTSSIQLDWKNGCYLYYDFGNQEGGNAIQLIQQQGDKVSAIIERCYGSRTSLPKPAKHALAQSSSKSARAKKRWLQEVQTAPLCLEDLHFWQTKISTPQLKDLEKWVRRVEKVTISDKRGTRNYLAPAYVYALMGENGQIFQLYAPQHAKNAYPFHQKSVFVSIDAAPYFGSYCPNADATLICEGVSDTLAALQLGYRSVITFGGTSQNTQTEKIQELLPTLSPQKLRFLFDTDTAGQKAAQRVQAKGFQTLSLPKLDGSASQNDLCDYLRLYGADLQLCNLLQDCGKIPFTYQKYLSDNPHILATLVADTVPKVLVAQTGAGKTTLMRQLAQQVESIGKNAMFITPMQGIAVQTELPDALIICQNQDTIADFQPGRHIVTTFESFKRLPAYNPQDYVLIIDEIHEVWKEHYRAHILYKAQKHHQAIGLTATYDRSTQVLLGALNYQVLYAQPQVSTQQTIHIAQYAKGQENKELIALLKEARAENKKVLVFSQDKTQNQALCEQFKKEGAVYVSADTKDETYHQDIVKKGYNPNLLFTTSVLGLGVNNLNYDVVICLHKAGKTLPSDIVQQFGRLRNGGERILLMQKTDPANQKPTRTLKIPLEHLQACFSKSIESYRANVDYRNLRYQNLSAEIPDRKYKDLLHRRGKNTIYNISTRQYEPVFENIFNDENYTADTEPQNEEELLEQMAELYQQVGIAVEYQRHTLNSEDLSDGKAIDETIAEFKLRRKEHFEALKAYILQDGKQGCYNFLQACKSRLGNTSLSDKIKNFLFDKPQTQELPIDLLPEYKREYQRVAFACLKTLKNLDHLPFPEQVELLFAANFQSLYDKHIHYKNLMRYQSGEDLQNKLDAHALRETERNHRLLLMLVKFLKPDDEVVEKINQLQAKLDLQTYIYSSPKTSQELAAELNSTASNIRSIRHRYEHNSARIEAKIEKLRQLPCKVNMYELADQLNQQIRYEASNQRSPDTWYAYTYKEIKERIAYFTQQDLSPVGLPSYEKVRMRKGTIRIFLSVAKSNSSDESTTISKTVQELRKLQHSPPKPPEEQQSA